MTRVAAIDCGTNSLRLLIADIDGALALRDVVRTLEVVRLGEGVDRDGRFSDDALARTLAVTRRYAQLCREHGAERIRFVATSATRDAANRLEFTDAVREILGVDAEVISGEEEAALSFRGALSVTRDTDAFGDTAVIHNIGAVNDTGVLHGGGADARHLVVDLGGGSTELAFGGTTLLAAHSMDVGCVRLTERRVRHDPPGDGELASIRRDVGEALDAAAASVDLSRVTDVIGVAGTVTTITAHALRLPAYDPVAIDGARLPLRAVLDACDSLASMPRDERAALPYMHPGRVDAIAAGTTIWSTILRRVADATAAAGRPLGFVTASEHDILDGVALSLAP